MVATPLVSAGQASAAGARVVLNGRVVATLRTPSVEGGSPTQRAALMLQELGRVQSAANLVVRKVGVTAVILDGDRRLVTVTPAEAAANKTTPEALAKAWVRNIKAAASASELILDTNALRLPEDSTQPLAARGGGSRLAVPTSDRKEVATLVATPKGWAIRTGKAGQAVVALTAGSTVRSVAVTVQPYAVKLPQPVLAEVTGPLAVTSTVEGAVTAALRKGLVTVPNARVRCEILDPTPIPAGVTKSVRVRVTAEANDAFPRSGVMDVTVRNVARPYRADAELWYCNDPETLRGPGNLFAHDLSTARPARLLYHHINETSGDLTTRVQVVNDSDQEAVLAITPGDGEPDKNPVLVGYRAGQKFFRPALSGSGEIVRIPARHSMPVSLRRLGPKENVSGLCRLELVSGPPKVLVRADAIPPFQMDDDWRRASLSDAPWREVGARPINDTYDRAPFVPSLHTYPDPLRTETVAFEVGGRYKYVRIGEKPIGRTDQAGALDGNFGVSYEVRAELSNPTNIAVDVEVVFEASAGYAGGLFVIGDDYVTTSLLQPKGESRLKKVRLAARSKQSLVIRTIPLSGASYPVTLTFRPVSAMDAVPSATVEGIKK